MARKGQAPLQPIVLKGGTKLETLPRAQSSTPNSTDPNR
jgi:hypothetical protein